MTLKVKLAAIYIQILLKLPASVPCTVAALCFNMKHGNFMLLTHGLHFLFCKTLTHKH